LLVFIANLSSRKISHFTNLGIGTKGIKKTMKTVVNLTSQSVVGEIEKVLDTYAYHPYQKAFALPDLRQELTEFVFSRVPCLGNPNEPDKACLLDEKFPRGGLEQKLYLQDLIHQGIFAIMRQKSEWISHYLSETVHPACVPSHWFG
jgi:hypothetical protein